MTIDQAQQLAQFVLLPTGGWVFAFTILGLFITTLLSQIKTARDDMVYERQRADEAVRQLMNDCHPDKVQRRVVDMGEGR